MVFLECFHHLKFRTQCIVPLCSTEDDSVFSPAGIFAALLPPCLSPLSDAVETSLGLKLFGLFLVDKGFAD